MAQQTVEQGWIESEINGALARAGQKPTKILTSYLLSRCQIASGADGAFVRVDDEITVGLKGSLLWQRAPRQNRWMRAGVAVFRGPPSAGRGRLLRPNRGIHCAVVALLRGEIVFEAGLPVKSVHHRGRAGGSLLPVLGPASGCGHDGKKQEKRRDADAPVKVPLGIDLDRPLLWMQNRSGTCGRRHHNHTAPQGETKRITVND